MGFRQDTRQNRFEPGILSRTNPRGAQSTPVSDGHVIIIGGAEDKVRDRVILSRFVTLAFDAQ